MGNLKFKTPPTPKGDKVQFYADTIQMPDGSMLGSESLFTDIMASGVQCEKYTTARHQVMKTFILLDVSVFEGVKSWLTHTGASDGVLDGYAGLTLREYLAKMFVKEDNDTPTP